MAEFPLAKHSEAVSKVLSIVLPPRTYAYLSAFLPGLFFEVSICLAKPRLVEKLIARSNEAANLGRYPKILIAIFLAFVLGNAFMLWAGTVHRILGRLFRMGRFLRRWFCGRALLPLLNRLVKRLAATRGWWNRRLPWIQTRISRSVYAAAYDDDFASEGMRKLWAILTRNLFKRNYGIDLAVLKQKEWDALYQAAVAARMTEFSDHLLMVASQALGWSGLAAAWFAPRLANRYYIGFNLFLIVIGILYQWQVIRRQNDEYLLGLLRVRALLRELRRGKKQAESPKDETGGPDS
jgi:hypothetical protein